MSGIVAIVDDYVPLLDSLRRLLEAEGHEVLTYASPASFLADRGHPPACLIVDYNMPGMTGLELVARLRQEGSKIPVLLTTGMLSPRVVECATRVGVEAVLEKPAEPDALLRFVNEYGQSSSARTLSS
ncbi:MAG: response regulator [Acetobacteraceae bacterium]|jgi:FixJ family two-component response regulator